jgi:type III secretion system YscI/HrpB-like protein
MTISSVELTSRALTDCFDQLPPLGNTTVLPEKQLVKSISQLQEKFTTLLESAQPTFSRLLDPQTMLAIQNGIMQGSLTVELTAKVAGSVTQSVNRLATLQ